MNHLGTISLESERLLMRRAEEKDAESLYSGYLNQEEFLYYANKEKKSLEDTIEMLKVKKELYQSKEYYDWVITLKGSDKVIGAINLKVNTNNNSVEFNYAIDSRYVCNGYMTEALNEVKKFCLNNLNVVRFQGGCCMENIASRRVMEKCEMHCEGILRKYIKLRDGYHDMCMFSIVKE